jgi:hypothetical protein
MIYACVNLTLEPSKFWELEHGSTAIYPAESRGREISRPAGQGAMQPRRSSSMPAVNEAAVQRWAVTSLHDFITGVSR